MKIMMLNPPQEWTVLEIAEADDPSEAIIDTLDYGTFPPLGALLCPDLSGAEHVGPSAFLH